MAFREIASNIMLLQGDEGHIAWRRAGSPELHRAMVPSGKICRYLGVQPPIGLGSASNHGTAMIIGRRLQRPPNCILHLGIGDVQVLPGDKPSGTGRQDRLRCNGQSLRHEATRP